MLEIKLGRTKDLENCIRLYVEDYNSRINRNYEYGYEEQSITYEQGVQRWNSYFNNNPFLVAYDNEQFLGFCTLADGPQQLYLEYICTASSMPRERIYAEFIFAAGRYALASGYSTMSTSINGKDEWFRDLVISLGARSDHVLGMMYTYYEKFVWDSLEWFLVEE